MRICVTVAQRLLDCDAEAAKSCCGAGRSARGEKSRRKDCVHKESGE